MNISEIYYQTDYNFLWMYNNCTRFFVYMSKLVKRNALQFFYLRQYARNIMIFKFISFKFLPNRHLIIKIWHLKILMSSMTDWRKLEILFAEDVEVTTEVTLDRYTPCGK